MIETQNVSGQVVITICNYERFQDFRNYRNSQGNSATGSEATQQLVQSQLSTGSEAVQIRTPDNTRITPEETPDKNRSSSKADDLFDDWYQHYPRKAAKGRAKTAYASALKKIDHETLVSAAKAYAEHVKHTDKQFIKQPATWLNGECWDDDLARDGPTFEEWQPTEADNHFNRTMSLTDEQISDIYSALKDRQIASGNPRKPSEQWASIWRDEVRRRQRFSPKQNAPSHHEIGQWVASQYRN
ncbi:MAG: hypothetical protein AAF141_05615 [Pseudomonadota bacterium]